MVSPASSSSRSGAPALVAGSAGAAKRLGGLTVRSRPASTPSAPSPETGGPEPRGPGTRALGGSARRQPRPETPALPGPAPRRAPPALPPHTAHAAGVPGEGRRAEWATGDPGSLPLGARGSVPAAPVACRRVAAPGLRAAVAWGHSGVAAGAGVPGGAQPIAPRRRGGGFTHQCGPPLRAAAAAEGPRWRRWPGPEAPPLPAPRLPAGTDLRGRWPPASPPQLIRLGHLPRDCNRGAAGSPIPAWPCSPGGGDRRPSAPGPTFRASPPTF